jgi:hypothetical protein
MAIRREPTKAEREARARQNMTQLIGGAVLIAALLGAGVALRPFYQRLTAPDLPPSMGCADLAALIHAHGRCQRLGLETVPALAPGGAEIECEDAAAAAGRLGLDFFQSVCVGRSEDPAWALGVLLDERSCGAEPVELVPVNAPEAEMSRRMKLLGCE